MEVPRLGVKSELQLWVYTTATAMWDLSCIWVYTTAHGNSGSLTHWARPGIELMFSRLLTTEPWRELPQSFANMIPQFLTLASAPKRLKTLWETRECRYVTPSFLFWQCLKVSGTNFLFLLYSETYPSRKSSWTDGWRCGQVHQVYNW